jgi:hypothetical protein
MTPDAGKGKALWVVASVRSARHVSRHSGRTPESLHSDTCTGAGSSPENVGGSVCGVNLRPAHTVGAVGWTSCGRGWKDRQHDLHLWPGSRSRVTAVALTLAEGQLPKQVLFSRSHHVLTPALSSGPVVAPHQGGRDPARLTHDQVGGGRQLVGHRDLGDLQLPPRPVA